MRSIDLLLRRAFSGGPIPWRIHASDPEFPSIVYDDVISIALCRVRNSGHLFGNKPCTRSTVSRIRSTRNSRARGLDRIHGLSATVNSPNHQHALFTFNLAADTGYEPAVARVNFARFQRAAESSQHSAGGGGNDVVDRGSVRFA